MKSVDGGSHLLGGEVTDQHGGGGGRGGVAAGCEGPLWIRVRDLSENSCLASVATDGYI